VVLVMMAAISSGCGYALDVRGSFLPSSIKTVGIPLLENRTPVSRVEQILTDRIRNEFIGRGKYNVLHEETGADAVLRGEILGFNFQTTGLNQQQLSSRYLVTIVVKVSFIDLNAVDKTKEVLWSNDALTFRDEYDLASAGGVNGATFVDQEKSAFDRIANDAARTIVTAIMEAF
jgi:hypothetical protein